MKIKTTKKWSKSTFRKVRCSSYKKSEWAGLNTFVWGTVLNSEFMQKKLKKTLKIIIKTPTFLRLSRSDVNTKVDHQGMPSQGKDVFAGRLCARQDLTHLA